MYFVDGDAFQGEGPLEISQGGVTEEQVAFEELQGTMVESAAQWEGLAAREKQGYVVARQRYIDRKEQVIAEQKADLLRPIVRLQADAERELQVRGMPTLVCCREVR